MSRLLWRFLTIVCVLAQVSIACAQEFTNDGATGAPNREHAPKIVRLRPRLVPTQAYRGEILRLMIEEANRAARDMKLSEELPITKSNLVGAFISPPGLFIHRALLGTIDTTNYSYSCVVGRTFSGVDQKNPVKTFYEAKAKFTWPVSRINTNSALKLGTRIMSAAGMDATALSRDCSIEITPSMIEGPSGKHFLPDYWIVWRKPGTNIAQLEFLEPNHSIRSLHVFDAKYILRKPAEIPNLVELLTPENTPEAIQYEWDIATNIVKLREFLIQNHAPESVLQQAGVYQTNAYTETNVPDNQVKK